jgi:hypothetical protein
MTLLDSAMVLTVPVAYSKTCNVKKKGKNSRMKMETSAPGTVGKVGFPSNVRVMGLAKISQPWKKL